MEDRRIRPACYTVSVSGQIMYRIYPYDTFFADSRVAECYSRIHPDWKLNREVWGRAAARHLRGRGQHRRCELGLAGRCRADSRRLSCSPRDGSAAG